MKQQQPTWWNEWVVTNGSYKLVALFITLILWVSVLGRKETTLTREIPLQFQVGEGRVITETSARAVRFELSGSRRALRRLARDKVDPITMELSPGSLGRVVVTVPDDTLKLPFGVKVVTANPSTVAVQVEEVVKKRVPVVIAWRDPHERNSVIQNARITPQDVLVEGGTSALRKVREVLTQDVSRADAVEVDGVWTIKTKLRAIELDGVRPVDDQEVLIQF